MKFFAAAFVMGALAEMEPEASTVQMLLLWDAGLARLQPDFTAKFMDSGVQKIFDDHFGIFTAFSSFSDKPAPTSGIGHYGGYPSHWEEDRCYTHHQGFSASSEDIEAAFNLIPSATSLDQWDAQFEAMLRGVYDRDLVWVPGTSRIVMLVTNSFGHSQALETLADNVNKFNAPVVCAADGKTTTGGFGATTMPTYLYTWVAPLNMEWEDLHEIYKTYTELLANKVCNPCAENLARDAEIARLEEKLAPIRVPEVEDFDLAKLQSDPEEHCRVHEYPSYADVVKVFREKETSFILIFADANPKDTRAVADSAVWQWAMESDEALADIPGVMQVITEQNLAQLPELVSAAINEVLNL